MRRSRAPGTKVYHPTKGYRRVSWARQRARAAMQVLLGVIEANKRA